MFNRACKELQHAHDAAQRAHKPLQPRAPSTHAHAHTSTRYTPSLVCVDLAVHHGARVEELEQRVVFCVGVAGVVVRVCGRVGGSASGRVCGTCAHTRDCVGPHPPTRVLPADLVVDDLHALRGVAGCVWRGETGLGLAAPTRTPLLRGKAPPTLKRTRTAQQPHLGKLHDALGVHRVLHAAVVGIPLQIVELWSGEGRGGKNGW